MAHCMAVTVPLTVKSLRQSGLADFISFASCAQPQATRINTDPSEFSRPSSRKPQRVSRFRHLLEVYRLILVQNGVRDTMTAPKPHLVRLGESCHNLALCGVCTVERAVIDERTS